MNLSKINNISFGNTYYSGYSIKHNCYFKADRDEAASIKNTYLTQTQKGITHFIEKILFPDDLNRKLDFTLERKNTNIIFKYEKDGNISLFLNKYGTDNYGNRYDFIPYNKTGKKKIKETFLLSNINLKDIEEKIRNFIKTCEIYLADSKNRKNKAIEKEIIG